MASNHIPKLIHVTWKSKDILDNQSPVILNGLRNLVDLNPNWKLEISDDQDVENYLKTNLSTQDYQNIQQRHIVEKSDLWRLLKIYIEGGLYIDIDRYCNVVLDDILDEETRCYLPTYKDHDFSQDIMLSAPQNPMFKLAIEYNLGARQNGVNRIYDMGAPLYMMAVTQTIFQQQYQQDPGAEAMETMRAAIRQLPFMKTYREDPPHDTIVYNHDQANFKAGNGKDKLAFYAEFGIKHWTEPK